MAAPIAMRELILQAYTAREKGHLDNLMSTFHANAVFKLAGDKDALPIAGHVEGHGNIRNAMEGFIGSFDFISRDIVSMIFENDRAAVHSRIKVRYVPNGSTSTQEILDLFKFQDGKIIELVEFADTALINKMISG